MPEELPVIIKQLTIEFILYPAKKKKVREHIIVTELLPNICSFWLLLCSADVRTNCKRKKR